jgi:hypothetical protein
MIRRAVVIGCSVLVVRSVLGAGPGCSPEATRRAAAQALKVQAELLAVKVEAEGMDEAVSPATSRLIGALKDALARTVDAQLRCESVVAAGPQALKASLGSLLAPGGVRPDAPPAKVGDHVFGDELEIAVRRLDVGPRLVAVELSFSVTCGRDTMLLLYQEQADRWDRVLRWQSGDYDKVSGAFGDFFEYLVLGSGTPGEWVAVVAHGTPWCTSRWSAYELDVVEPLRGRQPQRVTFQKRASWVRTDDEGPTLKARSDGFELRLEVGSLDADTMTRRGLYRYRVAGGTVKRVQPVAMNGRDFVDEWLQAPWSEAVGWSRADPELERAHERMMDLRARGGSAPAYSYGPVRPCSGDRSRFQVELDLEPGGLVYFQITVGPSSATMLSVSPQADPQCRGADIMPRR